MPRRGGARTPRLRRAGAPGARPARRGSRPAAAVRPRRRCRAAAPPSRAQQARTILHRSSRRSRAPSGATVTGSVLAGDRSSACASSHGWPFTSQSFAAVTPRRTRWATSSALTRTRPSWVSATISSYAARGDDETIDALAALAPAPGQLLWDIGAGSGSIAIEWLRSEPTGARDRGGGARRARRARRGATPSHSACRSSTCATARAPAALAGLTRRTRCSSAAGLTEPGLSIAAGTRCGPAGASSRTPSRSRASSCWSRRARQHGGDLVRLEVGHAEPLGRLHAWRPQLPIVQWSARKEPA